MILAAAPLVTPVAAAAALPAPRLGVDDDASLPAAAAAGTADATRAARRQGA
ncbi:MAG: hypothetical protein ABGX38_05035 [Thermoleophilia bacterium]